MHTCHRMLTALTVASLLLVAVSAHAGTLFVPGDYPTIQQALDAALPGDDVLVGPGTYAQSTNGESFPLNMQDDVPLSSQSGPDVTTIDAEGSSRVVTCDGVSATIQGFTITGGYASGVAPNDTGGGLLCRNSHVTLIDCRFIGNVADYEGGGICGDSVGGQCSLTVLYCVFIGNDGGLNGGGINASFVNPLLIHGSDFYDNHVIDHGGGFACFDSPARVDSCLFAGNRSELSGGGANVMGGGVQEFVGCTFAENWAASTGSAVQLGFGRSATALEHSIFSFNDGGQAISGGPSTMICCDVYGNPGGDWTPNISGWYGMNGNDSLDPLFCWTENLDPYTLFDESPCAPGNTPGCGLIGARGVGCTASPVQVSTWGAVKALYR